MRRRLTLLVLAVTSLVVVAFTIPLAALIAREADSTARSDAEVVAQSIAANLVRIAAVEGVEQLGQNLPPLPDGIGLVFPDDASAGTVTPAGRSLATAAAAQQRAVATYTTGGWELAIPVLTAEGPVIVTATVGEADLRQGVARAWTLLALLGLALIVAALVLADRLGRSLTQSVARLGAAARSLAGGDLATRVEVTEPEELRSVARAFNQMAPRLASLIAEEREEVADLSHQLRTPLTRLRLQIERVDQPAVLAALSAQLDDMEAAVDQLIAEARRRPDVPAGRIDDLGAFLRSRAAFWSVLADEQGRRFEVDIGMGPGVDVAIGSADLTAALDAVIGNVFDHTAEPAGFSLSTGRDDGAVTILVRDEGPGFPIDLDPTERGVSGAGSSGLGLDIARRTVERIGGALRVRSGPDGGAIVEMVLPLDADGGT